MLPMTFVGSTAFRMAFSFAAVLSMLPQTSAKAADARQNRLLIEYVPPTTPVHQTLYKLLTAQRTLEKLQELFSPVRLPSDLALRTVECGGTSNAWYHQ